MEAVERDLPEPALRWMHYRDDEDWPVSAELIKRCLVIQTDLKPVGIPGMEEMAMPPNYTLIYPVFVGDGFVLGRMEGSLLSNMTRGVLGRVTEERVCIVIQKEVPRGFFSVLHDSDSVVFFSMNLTNVYTGGKCLVTTYSREDPRARQPIAQYYERVECMFCQHRRVRCECAKPITKRNQSIHVLTTMASNVPEPKSSLYTWERLIHFLSSVLQTQSTALSFQTQSMQPGESSTTASFRAKYSYVVSGHVLDTLRTQHAQTVITKKRPYQLEALLISSDSSEERLPDNKPVRLDEDGKPSCPICGASFTRKYDVRRHMHCVHTDVKNYNCTKCKRKFALRQNLLQHMEAVHEKVRNASCPVCGKAFQTEQKVRRHIFGVHFKDRPYACKLCNSAFFQRSDLKRHSREKHGDGEKTFTGIAQVGH